MRESSRGQETWGDSCLQLQQMFLIFFSFSPMETLNRVSAYPVIYIGRDSYQGGLQLLAQTHQPGHLFPTKSCPWEPQMRCFRSVGQVFHLWPEEGGFPWPKWSRVESGEDTIQRLGRTPFWRNRTELSSQGAVLCHPCSSERKYRGAEEAIFQRELRTTWESL